MSWLRDLRSTTGDAPKNATLTRDAPRWLTDAFLDSYVSWREACDEVRSAYQRWGSAARGDAALAFAAFLAALDQEERAAGIHWEWAERLGARA